MSAVTQGPSAAAGALTGLARALVQQGKLRPDRAETLARKAVLSNTRFIDELVAVADATSLTLAQIAKFVDELRSEEHTSELQSPCNLVCRLLLVKKKS